MIYGKNFWCLVQDRGWIARANSGETERADTPTEAVARLWLTLNKTAQQ